MLWSSSMKNDFIATILPHRLASSESNFQLNDELITEFEWNWGVSGVRNDPILGVAITVPDMWVGMTEFLVALMTSRSTWGVIQTSSCRMEKSGVPDDNVIKGLYFHWWCSLFAFLSTCLKFPFQLASSISVWCTCIVNISDNFVYCHCLFAYVSDVIDCFQYSSIHYVNFK